MVFVINCNQEEKSDCVVTTSNCSTIHSHSAMRKPFSSSTENVELTNKNKMRLGWWTRHRRSSATSLVVLLAIIVVVLPVTWALGPPRGPPHPPPHRHHPHNHPPRRGPRGPPPPNYPRPYHHEHPQHQGPGRPPRGPNPSGYGYPHGPVHSTHGPHSLNHNANIQNLQHPHSTQMTRTHYSKSMNPLVTPSGPTLLQQSPASHSKLRKGSVLPGDLTPAAQSLYDLRGFHIGQQDQYLRQTQQHQQHQQQLQQQQHHQQQQNNQQEDLYPRPSPQNLFHSIVPPSPQHDPRTAPLVFPSFYQQQPRPLQPQPQAQIQLQNQQGNNQNIFGHQQHLQQTKFEPPRFINTVEDPGPGFRPSQVDHSGTATTENSFKPVLREPQTILNYQAPQLTQGQTRPANNNNIGNANSANSDEPFVYVYDDADYEDEEDDTGKNNNKNKIFSNAITPAPTKSRGNPSSTTSTAVPSPTPLAQFTSTFQPTLTPQQQIRQQQSSNFFFGQEYDPRLNLNFNQHNNPFESVPPQSLFNQGRPRAPNPGITPRPNVEIVPSSERKPPPDQSNAIPPALRTVVNNNNNNILSTSRPSIDDRHRRPTTTIRPQLVNFVQEQDDFEDNFNPPQNHQFIRPQQFQPQRNQFGAIRDNSNEDVDDETRDNQQQFFNQNHPDPILIQKLNPFLNPDPFHPPSRLRPVNTIVPKNRVPQEDIVLPPHFPELEDNRTPKDEEPSTTTTPTTTRKPFDASLRRNPNLSRTRTTSEATTTTTTNPPKRLPNRPKLRVNNRFTTTEYTTTTTPPPAYYEETSKEYDEDLRNQNIQDTNYDYQQTPVTKTRTQSINQNQFIRNNNYEEPVEVPVARKVRPFLSQTTPTVNALPSHPTTTRSRLNLQHQQQQQQHHQGRYSSPPPQPPTAQSLPPKKTGKPLYIAGKMLAKEGGLYAGQSIPHNHIYGAPAPPFVPHPFEVMFDGQEPMFPPHQSQPTFSHNNNQNQPQQQHHRRPNHLQNQHVVSEQPPHTSSYANQRLRLNKPTVATTSNSISHGHVQPDYDSTPETVRSHKDNDQARFRSPKPRFPTTRQPTQAEPSESSLPQSTRRKRPRPNQLKRVEGQQALGATPRTTEVVSVHAEVSEEVNHNNNYVTSSEAPRSPYVSESPQDVSTTPRALVNLRARRPRPRLGSQTTAAPEAAEEERQSNIPKPPRKLKRVRPRPNSLDDSTTSHPEYSESVSVSTQSSVKISRKPTETPGRFSSRFRDEDVTVLVSTPAGELSSVDTPRFNPSSKPRPTFRPPKTQKPKVIEASPSTNNVSPAPKPKRVRPQPQAQESKTEVVAENSLPANILLSPKDVVMNRKPARRIPPGSASDRLKALQERRRKIASRKQVGAGGDDEQAGENAPVVRRVVRIKPRQHQQQQQQQQSHDYNDDADQNQNKREITSRHNVPEKEHNDVKEYEEGEYDDYSPPKQTQFNLNQRNTSEVTSEEARSVLGIRIPSRTTTVPFQPTDTPVPVLLTSPKISSSPLFESLETEEEDGDTPDGDNQPSSSKSLPVRQLAMQQWTVSESTQSPHSDSTQPPVRETTSYRISTTTSGKLRPQLVQGALQQKRMSSSASPAKGATEEEEASPPRRSNAVSLARFLKRPLTTSSSVGTSKSNLFTMATEDPSLPLESFFPIVPHSITSSSSSAQSSADINK